MLEPADCLIDNAPRPLLFENTLRGQVMVLLQLIPVFDFLLIQREQRQSAASFLCGRAVPFVGEEVLRAREEKGSKRATFAPSVVEIPLFEHPREKFLGEISRIRSAGTLPAKVHVNGRPVGRAEVGKRFVGTRMRPVRRALNERPAGRDKPRHSVHPMDQAVQKVRWRSRPRPRIHR